MTAEHKVTVALDNHQYDILIGSDILQSDTAHQAVQSIVNGKKVVIITDTNVGAYHLNAASALLNIFAAEIITLSVPAGESKRLSLPLKQCQKKYWHMVLIDKLCWLRLVAA